MKILQSSQKLENKGKFLGFSISFIAHFAIVAFIMSGDFKTTTTTATAVNTTRISLDSFIVGGGESDLAPSKEAPEPVRKAEEVKKDEVEVVKDKIVKKVVEKKKKPKTPPKKPKPPKKTPPPKEKPNESIKASQKGGNNAINPSTNNIASSALTSDTPIQTLNESDKINIAAQIQAILASEARKNLPKSARFRNQSLTCKVSFDYGPNGEVSDISIVKSTGSKILDNVILKTINKTQHRFPPISVKSKFVVPVKFNFR